MFDEVFIEIQHPLPISLLTFFPVEIICDVITGAFEVSSKGGDGHKGQDGGPGADATDSSVVVSFFYHSFVKGQGHSVCYRFKRLKGVFSLGEFQELWSGFVTLYCRFKNSNSPFNFQCDK